MRSVRTLAAAAFVTAVLTACGSFGGDAPASTSNNEAASATQQGQAEVTVPEIPKGRITKKGDLCKLIPADKAAEVLGLPSVELSPLSSELEPGYVDDCQLFHDLGGGDAFVLNFVVRTHGEMVAREVRQLHASSKHEITELTIAGADEAFMANKNEVNIRKGDLLYGGSVSRDGNDPARTLAFVTMVFNAVS